MRDFPTQAVLAPTPRDHQIPVPLLRIPRQVQLAHPAHRRPDGAILERHRVAHLQRRVGLHARLHADREALLARQLKRVTVRFSRFSSSCVTR